MLPHQSVKVLATFQPPIPGLQYFDVGCKTLSGRVFKLEGKCEGLQPEVTLSHNVIKVGVCLQWHVSCNGSRNRGPCMSARARVTQASCHTCLACLVSCLTSADQLRLAVYCVPAVPRHCL